MMEAYSDEGEGGSNEEEAEIRCAVDEDHGMMYGVDNALALVPARCPGRSGELKDVTLAY